MGEPGGPRPIEILLIEDDPADARLIELMLREAKGMAFDITWAGSLTDGVRRLREKRPDAVLLDLGLPESTGLETLHRVIAHSPDVPTLVVLSGLTDEDVAVNALQAGAQDYLVKGHVNTAMLGRAIRYALGRSQAEEALRQARAEREHRDHLEGLVQERTAQLNAAKEKAEIASRTKTAFLASMSHDFRTPLNGILGFAQILQWDQSLSERQLMAVNSIRHCGEHLLTLINDLLDSAKIEAGKFELQPAPFDLRKFLQVVTDIIRVKVRQKPDVSLVCEFAPDLPAAVFADERRLRQVLLNLLDNAVKFTDRGRVALRVLRLPDTRIRFEIEDSGVGLDEAQLARMFQPFEQVGDRRRRNGGTGLGLVISRQFAQLMGSDIEVSSRVGVGSVFWFELALPEAAPAAEADASPPRLLTGYAGPRKKVLVIDDVPENRALLIDILGHLGFDMFEAACGHDGLEAAQALVPDLVLVDMLMPDIGGIDVIRHLRGCPALATLPIIAVSASATREVEAEALAAGASAFLSKPIGLPVLMDRVGALLQLAWTRAPAAAPG